MKLAPIVLFTYNRPEETRRVLNSLSANSEAGDSILYIYCDGLKENSTQENVENIKSVKQICRGENRFREVIVIENNINKGLAKSIIDGVTEVVNKHGKVIVLEDDLMLSPFFLFFMNDSLWRYENNPSVGSIGACNFFACGKKYPSSFFITLPDCWGWATWKDRWKHFESDATVLYNQLKDRDLLHKFNAYGSYDMEKMLVDQIGGNGTSWAVRWTAVSILKGWLSLYPNPSITNHIESKKSTNAYINVVPPLYKNKPIIKTIEVKEIPMVVEAMMRGYGGTGDYYGKLKRESGGKDFLSNKLKSFIPQSLKRIYTRYNSEAE